MSKKTGQRRRTTELFTKSLFIMLPKLRVLVKPTNVFSLSLQQHKTSLNKDAKKLLAIYSK